MNRRRCLTAITAAPLAWPLAPALAQSPVAPPAEVRLHLGQGARLQGSARLRWLGLTIYDARLWVGPAFNPLHFEDTPLALELIYARALKGPLIAERSIDEMRRGGPLPDDEAQRWLAFMTDAFPNIDEGDRLTGAWDPSQARSAFYVNGGTPRALRDPFFGPRFFGIWLAPYSSQPSMRRQLLGLGS